MSENREKIQENSHLFKSEEATERFRDFIGREVIDPQVLNDDI
jgi:hypothetical protein